MYCANDLSIDFSAKEIANQLRLNDQELSEYLKIFSLGSELDQEIEAFVKKKLRILSLLGISRQLTTSVIVRLMKHPQTLRTMFLILILWK